MITDRILLFAETMAMELHTMSDDELRTAARRMVGPFMHQLSLRGQSYTMCSDEFAVQPENGSSQH